MEMRKRRYKRKPYKPVNYDTIRETRLLAGLTRQQVADMLRVSLRSVQYWERGLVHMPYAAFRLLRILTGYELPGKEWKNWMLLRNKLISPEGKTFTPGDLYPLNWTIDKARLWDKEYRRRVGSGETTLVPFALPGNAWRGWMCHDGRLLSPDGMAFTPVHLNFLASMVDRICGEISSVPVKVVQGDTP